MKEDKKTETVVTEEQLLKSLQDLEGKKDETKTEEKPVVETVLVKSVKSVIAEGDSKLRKALDVSEVLNDFVGAIGVHVDATLSEMAKSINAGRERDLAVIGVLTALKKSIDENTAAVKAYGDKPIPAGTVNAAEEGKTVLLEKSTKAEEKGPEVSKKDVLRGLEIMVKSADADISLRQRLTNETIKYEATNQIDKNTLADALRAAGKLK